MSYTIYKAFLKDIFEPSINNFLLLVPKSQSGDKCKL